MKYFSKTIFTICIILLSFFTNTSLSFSANLSFGNPPFYLSSSDDFYLDVQLDTEGEYVNAIEGVITFPDDLVEVVDIYNGKSVVTSWLTYPAEDGSSIVFAGIMAGGFKEAVDPVKNIELPGNIMRIVFRPLQQGAGTISFDNSAVYLNDGKGSLSSLTTDSLSFVLSQDGVKMTDYIKDLTPPEMFEPIITKQENVFDGKYFVIFETKDLGTGIAYYEIKEGRGEWQKASSPYELKDQSLKSPIKIKAVDIAGNETIASVGYKYQSMLLILSALILLVALFVVRRLKRFLLRGKNDSKTVTDKV